MLGLIAAGIYPNPVGIADFVASTTHKILRGPRGGFVLAAAQHEKALNSIVFPGLQGGPLMHVIAAKAVAFKEALQPEFKTYQDQVLKNARTLAETLSKRGLHVVSGRTESHMFWSICAPRRLLARMLRQLSVAPMSRLTKTRFPIIRKSLS